MDPNYRTPVTEEFNGGYTWALNSKSVIEAEYVHVLSLHENKTINVDPNIPVDPSNITTLDRTGAPGGFFRPLDAAFNAAGVPLLGSVRDESSIGRSRYDGMNLSTASGGSTGLTLRLITPLPARSGMTKTVVLSATILATRRTRWDRMSLDRRLMTSGTISPSQPQLTCLGDWKSLRSFRSARRGPITPSPATIC